MVIHSCLTLHLEFVTSFPTQAHLINFAGKQLNQPRKGRPYKTVTMVSHEFFLSTSLSNSPRSSSCLGLNPTFSSNTLVTFISPFLWLQSLASLLPTTSIMTTVTSRSDPSHIPRLFRSGVEESGCTFPTPRSLISRGALGRRW